MEGDSATETVARVIAYMPDGIWANLKQGIEQHAEWNLETWRVDSLFPVKEFVWKQGLTPWSDWQVRSVVEWHSSAG